MKICSSQKLRYKLIAAALTLLLVLQMGGILSFADTTGQFSIVDLKSDHRMNPVGIDSEVPSFSWVMQSNQRAKKQTAYRLTVASSPGQLQSGDYDCYDSGRRETDQSVAISYEGKELAARTRYYWQVEVWDETGASAVSQPAYFETGLMDEGFAAAQWIQSGGVQSDPVSMGLDGASWLWKDDGLGFDARPQETLYFRGNLAVDPEKTVKEAFFGFTADDYGTVYLNGDKIASITPAAEVWRTGFVASVTALLTPGDNTFAAEITNGAEGYAGFIAKAVVRYTDGTEDVFVTDGGWKLTASPQENWTQPGTEEADWETPGQLVSYGGAPWGNQVHLPGTAVVPKESAAPMLRREFSANKVKTARLYATAAGIYEMSINGKAVSDHCFDPGWTDYQNRILYQTYDVTGLVSEGDNVISAVLGNGWYCGNIAQSGPNQYGTAPALIARLELEYQDGSRESVVTDAGWKVTDNGPILENDLLIGETYDATREMPGWDQPGFDDSGWAAASTSTAEALGVGKFEAQTAPSVEPMLTLPAVAMTQPEPGVYIYDFGQNFSGNVCIEVQGEAGTTVRLRHGEILNDASGTGDGPEGTLFTANLRSARATDFYTLKGDGTEVYTPRFTFHGFRYVELTGLDEPLPLEAVTGRVLYSAMEGTGGFTCSNTLVNQLYSNTLWSQRSNFISIPTDCPQRDERLGWTGDAQVFARTASYNMDTYAFYSNYLDLVRAYQRADGAYPSNAPWFWDGHGENGWGDAGVIIPWQMYQQYGDKQVIRDNYDAMKAWIAYLEDKSTDLIQPNGGYGDWMSIAGTPSTITNTAYFAYSTRILGKMAAAIGEEQDAAAYLDLFERIRTAWNNAFVLQDGSMAAETQTAYIVGLAFELFPDEMRDGAAKRLAENIQSNGDHLTTGFVGTNFLNLVLSQTGYDDVAYRLLEQESYPSWLYPVTQGATTIWETWNSYSKESGFSSGLGQNVSLNHYSYGAICEWIYRDMLGIERDEEAPGYQHFTLHPAAGGSITYAKGHYDTPYGTIRSGWELDEDKGFLYQAEIPANTTATLCLPEGDGEILESGGALSGAQGVALTRTEGGRVYLELASGTYSFTVPMDLESLHKYVLEIDNPQGIDAQAVVDGETYSLPMKESVPGGTKEIKIVSGETEYAFACLSGDAFSAAEPGTIRLDRDTKLTSHFVYQPEGESKNEYTLSIDAEQGTVLKINGQERELPYSETFQRGGQVCIDLKAPQGKRLTGWDGLNLGTPALLSMESDLELSALFEPVPTDKNLALGQTPFTNNSQETGDWSIGRLTDGVTTGTGYTSAKFASADTRENPPYFGVDLGSLQTIDRVVLYPRTDGQSFAEGTHYFPRDFTVSVSNEKDGEYTVVRSFTGHPDTSEPVQVEFEPVEARYVRVTATLLSEKITPGDAPRYQMAEMEVYCTSLIPAAVEEITLTAEKNSIGVRETLEISAALSPSNAQNPELTWMIQNAVGQGYSHPSPNAAYRLENGKLVLTGLSDGAVEVVARAADGRGAVGRYRVVIKSTPEVNKSQLEKALEAAEETKGGDLYQNAVPGAREAFDTALQQAQGVYQDGNASQDEVDRAVRALQAETERLRSAQAADKQALQAVVSEAETLDLSAYTDDSAEALRSALDAARLLLQDDTLTTGEQDRIDRAADALRRAADALEKKPGNPSSDPFSGGSGQSSSPSSKPDGPGHAGSPQTGAPRTVAVFALLAAAAGAGLITFKKRRG